MSAASIAMADRYPLLRRNFPGLPVAGLVCASILPCSGYAAAPVDLPAAIYSGPPADATHPGSGRGVQFRSHGALLNAQLYQPSGTGPHPSVVLLHGLPGNEQNLDLAQAMRRAGWTVITFHFRGSWGSGGRFSLLNCIEDAKELLLQLQKMGLADSWGVDPKHLVLMGHSYGGDVAALVASRMPGLLLSATQPDSDLGFNDHRIALQAAVLRWLATLD
jgi:uncharacterized protein